MGVIVEMMVYFDNSATTKLSKKVLSNISYNLANNFGNPSSLHTLGLNAEILLEDSREIIANALNTEKNSIYFTSSGTMANNAAIFGAASALKKRGNHVITTSVEHPSVINPFKKLESMGFNVTYITPTFNSEDLIKEVVDNITDDTILVSIMMVNNETGQMLDVFKIADAVKQKNRLALFHTDAVQAFMKFKINLKNSNIDLLTFSGHKIHAPKGIAGLYIKKNTNIKPIIFGGKQENNIFPGTQNVCFASALATSVTELQPCMDEHFNHVLKLNDYLKENLLDIKGSFINSFKECSPYIISLGIKGIKSEILLHYLSEKNIFVSSGSACAKGEKSKALKAYGIDNSIIDSTVRISLSHYNNKNEIDYFLDALKKADKDIIKI